jgi:signal transduction histidine kinase
MIRADRQQLRQLFLNVFTNAADAMPNGGTLTIRTYTKNDATGDERRATSDATHVVVEIADTGVGISPPELAKVLEPFYTTKPEGKGTGLGLAICRRIVQEHGGALELLSEGIAGKGTTVRVTLPLENGTNRAHLSN